MKKKKHESCLRSTLSCQFVMQLSIFQANQWGGISQTKAPHAPLRTLLPSPCHFYRNKDEHKGRARRDYRKCERRVDPERGSLAGPVQVNTCSLMNVELRRLSLPSVKERTGARAH